ncbi:hypothetical protein RO3G_12630 [Rhizopus delemar RA 99-880]|uniref:Uncharacterized protein n=3 Tax=Rhizopus TaxID=4842 RepID=I1CHI9_RHIO9|nr:hypothetical protein RO3G_12630 [Rhizopus delemar RA 99-880]|eukprot:EIE87919.1 hypothetical protein RO3G_12630 [Rhizopus delemar RA 99-880]
MPPVRSKLTRYLIHYYSFTEMMNIAVPQQVLPGYKLASEVEVKRNNVKLTEHHSQFIDDYVEEHPTCIVKNVTDSFCAVFDDLSITESNVYRHITDKLQFTFSRTQPRISENMVRPVRWSKKGTPVEVEVQPEGTRLSILGCMPAYGLNAVS